MIEQEHQELMTVSNPQNWILRYICFLFMPVCSLRAEAIDEGTPLLSVSGHPLHLSPGVAHLLFPCVSLPGALWPTTSPLPWGGGGFHVMA